MKETMPTERRDHGKKKLTISIHDPALSFEAIRSSGAGGQNVNKRDTQVRLYLDIKKSISLTDSQKNMLLSSEATDNITLRKVRNQIDKDGVLRVSSQEYKTQERNKIAAFELLNALLDTAFYVDPQRKEGLTKKAKGIKKKKAEGEKLRKFKQKKQKRNHW